MKKTLTKEQKVLLEILKLAINGGGRFPLGERIDLSAVNWGEVLKESIFQAVCFIAFENSGVVKEYIPENIYRAWSRRVVKIIGYNVDLVNSQNEMINVLNGKYDYCILKGLASAAYYPNPSLRDLGDVDFLVEKDKVEELKTLFTDKGYTCFGDDNDHHVLIQKPSQHLEMHYEAAGIPFGEKGEKIRSFLNGVLNNVEKVKIDEDIEKCEFLAPSDLYHGLILLLHMQHHMLGEGIGLRHLVDWACFVNKTHSEPFWKEQLLPFLKDIGLYTYAAAMTKTCSIYFETFCPEWCVFVSDKLCEEIIIDVFSLGNFGYKNQARSVAGQMISDHGKDGLDGKFRRIWMMFNTSVRYRHPSLEKHKILYPVFYVYEFFRYIKESLTGKKPKISAMIRASGERKSIYKKLRIFEV